MQSLPIIENLDVLCIYFKVIKYSSLFIGYDFSIILLEVFLFDGLWFSRFHFSADKLHDSLAPICDFLVMRHN